MKNCLFLIIFFAITVGCTSQKQIMKQPNFPFVKVTDWSQKSFLFAPSFWDGKKEELDNQLGEGGFERVKKYSFFINVPTQMTGFNGHSKIDITELNKKLTELKDLQRIASFHHVFQGNDYGTYDVINVPYEPNKNWDTAARWDTIYFIIPSKYVEELKQ